MPSKMALRRMLITAHNFCKCILLCNINICNVFLWVCENQMLKWIKNISHYVIQEMSFIVTEKWDLCLNFQEFVSIYVEVLVGGEESIL